MRHDHETSAEFNKLLDSHKLKHIPRALCGLPIDESLLALFHEILVRIEQLERKVNDEHL